MTNSIKITIKNKNCIEFYKAKGNLSILYSSEINDSDYTIVINNIKSELNDLGTILEWKNLRMENNKLFFYR